MYSISFLSNKDYNFHLILSALCEVKIFIKLLYIYIYKRKQFYIKMQIYVFFLNFLFFMIYILISKFSHKYICTFEH